MAESHEHIFLNNVAKSEKFTSTSSMVPKPSKLIRDRGVHASYLLSRFERIWNEQEDQKQQREAIFDLN